MARNYSVYVRNIPQHLLSNKAVIEYFNRMYNNEKDATTAVIDCNVALIIPNLTKLVAERDAIYEKLEHAKAIKEIKGITPTHSTSSLPIPGSANNNKVDSIEAYTTELAELNEKVKDAISKLEEIQEESPEKEDTTTLFDAAAEDEKGRQQQAAAATTPEDAEEGGGPGKSNNPLSVIQGGVSGSVSMVTNTLGLNGKEDGEKLTAAFVSFRSLKYTNLSIKMNHNSTPYTMEVMEAPDPEGTLL